MQQPRVLGGTASTRKCASQLWPATGVARRQRWLLQLCSRALPQDERVAALEAEVADLRAQLYSGGPAAQQAGGRKLSLRKEEWDLLPARIILLRHAESLGNVDKQAYCTVPDHAVPLTEAGMQQARDVGMRLRASMDNEWGGGKLFIMTSPYRRTLETTDAILESFTDEQVAGVRQAVQLRELEYGNMQHPDKIAASLTERQQFSRVWYRFPDGESCADVFDRITIFEDHLSRDMLLGRFQNCTLLLVTHGLTMRIWLWRWFHWTVDEFMEVYNPPNAEPIVLEKLSWQDVQALQSKLYAHAKHAYAITDESRALLRGTLPCMSSYFSRNAQVTPLQSWRAQRERMAARGLYTTADCWKQEGSPPPSSTGSSLTVADDQPADSLKGRCRSPPHSIGGGDDSNGREPGSQKTAAAHSQPHHVSS